MKNGEERGFTAAEFRTAQNEGWEKQYPYKVGKKKVYMTPSAAEAQGLVRADKHPKSTRYGRQNPLAERWNSEEQLLVWRAAWAEHINRYLEQAGLARYFSRITGGDQVSHSKPDPEIFLLSCRHFDIAPEDALVLEDSENGLLAAHNGKIPAICIPDMKYPAALYRDYAVYIAGSARDVTTYFS
mgnify:CR=1 FL=1